MLSRYSWHSARRREFHRIPPRTIASGRRRISPMLDPQPPLTRSVSVERWGVWRRAAIAVVAVALFCVLIVYAVVVAVVLLPFRALFR